MAVERPPPHRVGRRQSYHISLDRHSLGRQAINAGLDLEMPESPAGDNHSSCVNPPMLTGFCPRHSANDTSVLPIRCGKVAIIGPNIELLYSLVCKGSVQILTGALVSAIVDGKQASQPLFLKSEITRHHARRSKSLIARYDESVLMEWRMTRITRDRKAGSAGAW